MSLAIKGTGDPKLMVHGVLEAVTTTEVRLFVGILALRASYESCGEVDRLLHQLEAITIEPLSPTAKTL
jgi:hypothetical protein